MIANVMLFMLLIFVWIGIAVSKKRGLSGPNCGDAAALGLKDSWFYNWAAMPDGKGPHCEHARAAEFAPMFWTCGKNCTSDLPDNYMDIWKQAGVQYILGFNEPDNEDQSNLSPAEAVSLWPQIQKLASQFSPPLQLVSPGMTHWNNDGSVWLDQFFGNCTQLSGCDPSLIKYVAFHDYSGSANNISYKADAAFKKYNRKIWLTEFSQGNGKDRATNDALMKQTLPKLEKAESVFRYAWYSTRNAPAGWVAESSLLPYTLPPWTHKGHTNCSQMMWLSGASWKRGTLAQCAAKAQATANCTTPKTISYESGGNQNCYCANSRCVEKSSEWQNLYIEGKPATWDKSGKKECSASTMTWLSNVADGSVQNCKTLAQFTNFCTHPKTIMYENGNTHNCYCGNSSKCVQEDSTYLDMYVQENDLNGTSHVLTSTGKLYASL